ncbi:MAG TPA: CoA transferase, partial [Kiritimatiellia bacterium]
TIRSDKEWASFCTATGNPKWASDSRFKSNELRRTNHDELGKLIGAWTVGQDAGAAMKLLQSAGIAAGRVATARDIAEDEHLAARGWFQVSPDSPKEKRYPGFPFRFAADGGSIRRRGPALGVDNRRVFCEEMGLPDASLPVLNKDTIRTAFELT